MIHKERIRRGLMGIHNGVSSVFFLGDHKKYLKKL